MSNITRSTPIELSGDDNDKSNKDSSIIFGKKVNMILVFCCIVAIFGVIFVNCVLNIHNVIHTNRTYKKRMRVFFSFYILDVLFNFQSLVFKHKDDFLEVRNETKFEVELLGVKLLSLIHISEPTRP